VFLFLDQRLAEFITYWRCVSGKLCWLEVRMVQAETAAPVADGGIRRDLLNKLELANELGISTRTVDRWNSLRIGPPRVRIGKSIFYRRASVLQWLARHEEKQIRSHRG
jgi:predicted DNA-binding transcriptional regulator AlpA